MTSITTKTVRVDPEHPSRDALADAARALRGGELVVFPTETVYGIGANALDGEAVGQIFEAKGRPATNPLIVHVTSVKAARGLVSHWPEQAARLAARFWPGPLTLVLHKHEDVPDAVTAGRPNVALRLPAHPVAQALLELAGVPVCAPSANPYMSTSPTRAEHVLSSALNGKVSWVVDGGSTRVGVESTVLSLLDPQRPVLLRPGMITPSQIAQVLGQEVIVPEGGVVHDMEGEGALSPGTAARHYAPRAQLLLVDEIPWTRLPKRSGVLCTSIAPHPLVKHTAVVIELGNEPAAYARGLYDALHRFDETGVSVIYVQKPPHDDEAWRAVHDRLSRAATP